MASNDSTITDEHGEYDDWIELYNNTNNPIDLSGYYLSDNYLLFFCRYAKKSDDSILFSLKIYQRVMVLPYFNIRYSKG